MKLISLSYLKLNNYLLLDWSTNTKSSIAYTRLLIMIECQEPCEIISVFSLASPFFFPRCLLFALSLIPDVLLVLYNFTPKINALSSHLLGILLHIFSDIEKQCSKGDFYLLSYLCEVEANEFENHLF